LFNSYQFHGDWALAHCAPRNRETPHRQSPGSGNPTKSVEGVSGTFLSLTIRLPDCLFFTGLIPL